MDLKVKENVVEEEALVLLPLRFPSCKCIRAVEHHEKLCLASIGCSLTMQSGGHTSSKLMFIVKNGLSFQPNARGRSISQ